MDTKTVLALIAVERERQDQKWGYNRQHDPRQWLLVLQEELGEVARNILEDAPSDQTVNELIQCAAVLVAWLENHDIEFSSDEHYKLWVHSWREVEDELLQKGKLT